MSIKERIKNWHFEVGSRQQICAVHVNLGHVLVHKESGMYIIKHNGGRAHNRGKVCAYASTQDAIKGLLMYLVGLENGSIQGNSLVNINS
jgi:hypothetical protein